MPDNSDANNQSRQRRADNEMLFQRANEGLADALDRTQSASDDQAKPVHFHCECSDLKCRETVNIPVNEFSEARGEFQYFLAPGHDQPDLEDIVKTTDHYVMVEKKPELR